MTLMSFVCVCMFTPFLFKFAMCWSNIENHNKGTALEFSVNKYSGAYIKRVFRAQSALRFCSGSEKHYIHCSILIDMLRLFH